ncbi:MAG: CRISPR-associated helicase Cas3' [Clostridiales bacterium]|nr:CRISPR-associated helicase Cas3' [Clostridiales bacterium]
MALSKKETRKCLKRFLKFILLWGMKMIKLIDFNKFAIARGVFYGGDAGAKDAVIYEGDLWMIKYPKTTRDLQNPQISYTTSPLSEYLGSKIYEALGIPVHETILGIRNNKVVVACKDFTRIHDEGELRGVSGLWPGKQLIPFHDLKNSFMSSDLESYSGTGSETLLDEVLATIAGQEDLKAIPGVNERFWDMFVVDAFIGNNDRNNGNWGLLLDQRNYQSYGSVFSLAPVYDNGNAFFNKRSLSQMTSRINNEKAMQDDAYKSPKCAYKYRGLDNEGHRINPFFYITQMENKDLNAAVVRFVNKVDMDIIREIIYNIPESEGNFAVMPDMQKEFYLKLMQMRLNDVIAPAAKEIMSNLEQVYLAHITDDGREQTILEHSNEVSDLIYEFAATFGSGELARVVGRFHDVGKYSDAFQRRIRGSSIKADHSTAGGQMFFLQNKNMLGMIAAYCIMGHHGGMPNGGNKVDGSSELTLQGRFKRQVEDYSAFLSEMQPPTLVPPIIKINDVFGAHFFTRFLFSSLVDADYLDTERFFDKEKFQIRDSFISIEELYVRLRRHIEAFLNPQDTVSELDAHRTLLLKNCLSVAEESRGLFTLTAPTGSGKTISSLSFALAHALKNNLHRVIYVVPYNTIIEQNAKVFEDILGKEIVLQHHSNINYDENEEDYLGNENERKRLAAENWDYPIIVTSSVQFFESLFSAKPTKCRKIHNIAGSVVIFDEAQMIPPPFLLPCVRAISELVENYNCSAILATATQSALDKYFGPILLKEIVVNPAEMYEFFRRTTIKQLQTPFSNSEIVQHLVKHEQVLCIVNTRKQAQLIFSSLQFQTEGVFHLSTTMYPEHRSRTLAEIRDRLEGGLPCRVISTSMVEAGVDLDFPVVYREKIGLDSIIQAAGRCNREGKRPLEDSCVYVFNSLEQQPTESMQILIGTFDQIADSFAEDLSSLDAVHSYFEQLFYNKGDDALDAKGILSSIQQGKSSFNIPFRDIADKFRIIEDDTTTVFILCNIPELEARLRVGERSRALFRKLSQYGVSLKKYEIEKLRALRAIEDLDREVLLLSSIYYNDCYGVELSPEGGKAIFLKEE